MNHLIEINSEDLKIIVNLLKLHSPIYDELCERMRKILNEKYYFVLEENNDWEGETWYRAFPVTENNTEVVAHLKVLFEEGPETEYECPYSIWDEAVTLSWMEQQPNNTSYTSTWDWTNNELDKEKVMAITPKLLEDSDPFYKCGLFDLVQKENV